MISFAHNCAALTSTHHHKTSTKGKRCKNKTGQPCERKTSETTLRMTTQTSLLHKTSQSSSVSALKASNQITTCDFNS